MDIESLAVDLPYPSLAGMKPDRVLCEMLFTAYSANHSELNAILQYVYHQMFFEKLEMFDIAHVYQRIFINEMHHLHLLGQAIIKLGGDPVYIVPPPPRRTYYSAAAVSYSATPARMLLDDISGERDAIAEYNAMIEKSGKTPLAALLRRIVMDEELHYATLKELYGKTCCD